MSPGPPLQRGSNVDTSENSTSVFSRRLASQEAGRTVSPGHTKRMADQRGHARR